MEIRKWFRKIENREMVKFHFPLSNFLNYFPFSSQLFSAILNPSQPPFIKGGVNSL